MRSRTLPSLPGGSRPRDGLAIFRPARVIRRDRALFAVGVIEVIEQTVVFSQRAGSPGAPLAEGRYRR